MDSEALRAELKSWEKTFLVTKGHKPGKEDIKADPVISAKYKKYDLLRRPPKSLLKIVTPQKRSAQLTDNVTPSKRRALGEQSINIVSTITTPQRRSKHKLAAPSQGLTALPQGVDQPTPAFIRCALGPTPQKDGQVLGIFDMLPTATISDRHDTPSKSRSRNIDVSCTPSKTSSSPSSAAEQLLRTPMSSGKRYYLEAFAGTPQKRKRDDEDAGTPSTTTNQFATPSFLRRSFPLASIDEEADLETERLTNPPPFKKRGLARSLSSMIQGLRKQEEEKMDDDWDILNEIEAEEVGKSAEPEETTKTLVPDSQSTGDSIIHRAHSAEASESAQEQDTERKRKPWKKKGLKRQTRRVIMRPILHKARKASEHANNSESEELESDDGMTQIVKESQLIQSPAIGTGKPSTQVSSSRSEGTTQSTASNTNLKKSDRPNLLHEGSSLVTAQSKHTREESGMSGNGVKKAVRKISATAHANFRALKIKNKNSKGKGRHSGKFGRR